FGAECAAQDAQEEREWHGACVPPCNRRRMVLHRPARPTAVCKLNGSPRNDVGESAVDRRIAVRGRWKRRPQHPGSSRCGGRWFAPHPPTTKTTTSLNTKTQPKEDPQWDSNNFFSSFLAS